MPLPLALITEKVFSTIATNVKILFMLNLALNPGLRGSLPNNGPLDFATKNSFPVFLAGEEAFVGIY